MDLKLLLLLSLLLDSAPPRLEKTRPPFSRRVLGVIGASRDVDEDEGNAREYSSLVGRDERFEEFDEGFSTVVIEEEEEEEELGVSRPT